MEKANKKMIAILLITVIAAMSFAGCQAPIKEEEVVVATITEKEFVPEKTGFRTITVGKTTTIGRNDQPRKYLVTISYEDVDLVVNNQELFTSSEVNDAIEMVLHSRYYKNGNLFSQELKFPE